MEMVIAALGLGVAAYVFVTGQRNRDPLNKKCAIEIADYLVSSDALEPDDIYQIFKRNGRFQTQARHVASMVADLLTRQGCPTAEVSDIVPLVRAAASRIPQ